MVKMPMTQDQSFQIRQLHTAFFQNLSDVLFNTQTRNMIVQQIRNGWDGIPEVRPRPEVEDQLFSGLIILDVERPVWEVAGIGVSSTLLCVLIGLSYSQSLPSICGCLQLVLR